MAGPIYVPDIGIVLGALIDILDHERDRRAGGHLLAGRIIQKHAGKDFDRVGFLPLGGEARLAGAAAVKIGLNVGSVKAMRGGQPSMTQPIAGPWLSPKVVTRKECPNVL